MRKVNTPEGVSGDWEVKKFTITPNAAAMSVFSYGTRAPEPGTYTKLTYNGQVIMSDTPAEMRDHYAPVRMTGASVLINGLGLGMVLLNCMRKWKTKRAIVVEKSEDVIKLVAPTYKSRYGNRIEIVHADAFLYKPPKGLEFDMVWHDIWPDISADNYEEMKKLHRKYGRITEWQDSWCRDECRRLNKEDY